MKNAVSEYNNHYTFVQLKTRTLPVFKTTSSKLVNF